MTVTFSGALIPMEKYNYFASPFKGIPLDQQVKNPNIVVGRFSYYSGYYHGHSFDDCARYLMPDRDDVDKPDYLVVSVR